MKNNLTLIALFGSLLSQPALSNTSSIEFSPNASKFVGDVLRRAEHSKWHHGKVRFGGGPQVTTYSLDGITCYFQNSDDTVSCSAMDGSDLSKDASFLIGHNLRAAELRGDKSVTWGGSAQVTTYNIENLTCYFQNSDGSVSCSVTQ